jgi:hypothetical protein
MKQSTIVSNSVIWVKNEQFRAFFVVFCGLSTAIKNGANSMWRELESHVCVFNRNYRFSITTKPFNLMRVNFHNGFAVLVVIACQVCEASSRDPVDVAKECCWCVFVVGHRHRVWASECQRAFPLEQLHYFHAKLRSQFLFSIFFSPCLLNLVEATF